MTFRRPIPIAAVLKRFLRSKEGNFSGVLAAAIVPVAAAVAGTVDFVSTNIKIAQLENSLDAAALEIGTKYYSGMPDEELQRMGRNIFLANMLGSEQTDPDFEYEDVLLDRFGVEVQPSGNEDYVTVRSQITHESMIGWSFQWTASRASVVRLQPGQPACVLALDPHAASAIKIQGSAQVHMTGCVLASNSDSPTSIERGGSAELTAKCAITTGGTSGLAASSYVDLECGAPLENQYPSDDPLALTPLPSSAGCTKVPGGKTVTLKPGTYCNETLSGEVTLEPGTYVLRGGGVKLGGNGYLKGAGVTIFLMEDAEFTINANQLVQLSPPTSGTYMGITLFQPRSNTEQLTINGTSGSDVTGFIYAPGAHVFHAGNSTVSGHPGCIRIVGRTVEMTGNSDVRFDCTGILGEAELRAGREVTIVR